MTDSGTYRRLAALAHAGRRLALTASSGDAIDRVAHVGLEALGGDSATVGHIEHEHGLLRILRNVGDLASWENEYPDDEVYPLGDFAGLSVPPERAAAWSASLDRVELPETERALLRALGKHSMVVVPLIVDGVVWGIISVIRGHDRPPFDAEDLAVGEALGGLLGSTLGRMADRDELEALAYRDALTGLGNRRSVDDRLEAAFERDPLRASVSVVLCDVNGLKRVNDDHGHDAGDRLLRDVGRLLSTEAGSLPGVLAARLGGDEFCLVLEGFDEANLQQIADRLSRRADELTLGDGLSCGWAVAARRPGDAATALAAGRGLLRLADAAQYRAKRKGRDGPPAAGMVPSGDEGSVAAEVVERATRRLTVAGGEIVDRLTAVATALHDATDAAAWAVSLSEDGGPVTIVRNLDRPRHSRADIAEFEPGMSFDLKDYPATREALAGGSFHATLLSGDDSERGFLASSGYAEMVGAGRTTGRDGWLVEICGDALSEPLMALEPLLRVLVELAVAGASDEADQPAAVAGIA